MILHRFSAKKSNQKKPLEVEKITPGSTPTQARVEAAKAPRLPDRREASAKSGDFTRWRMSRWAKKGIHGFCDEHIVLYLVLLALN